MGGVLKQTFKIMSLSFFLGAAAMVALYLAIDPFLGREDKEYIFSLVVWPVGYAAVMISIMIIDK
ncbi:MULTISPECIES: hypothetical protein [Bacillus]|jgi:hypothetical protein|uniref:Uncharacterized protein n=1 Tax=Bacillus licheniformis TaxID=1402 RepID=A0A8B5Y782_BACLI|nr:MULTISPECIES: hypothetical protein [Bacillus subtilis group]MDE1375004.1 hypothetical protein [Bacillus licheniformis]MDZ5538897.1 hypothetical protein [Bacillus licheniformis]MED1234730.1 hypothetical protein [Bacillus paralicheniformis]OKS83002.1 hypothetical protein BFN05_07840 [Bacillus licheniformis]OLQ45196.1 hypothetical protein BHT96_18570 [Bacillus licheniformis]